MSTPPAGPASAYQPGFSDAVHRALAKWPDVPACHGWLALDRRGRWRITGSLITHAGAVSFLNAHYASDGSGRWYVQNGPQTAFVDLELTPWVLTVEPDGSLKTQTGLRLAHFDAIFVTEHGDLLLATPLGLAAVSDRDLALFAGLLSGPGGEDALTTLAGLRDGAQADLASRDGARVPASFVPEAALLTSFGVIRRPQA